MASPMMHLTAVVVRVRYRRRMRTAEHARRRMASPGSPADPPSSLRRNHTVEETAVDGLRCWTVTPAAPTGRGVLYLHGGAYIAPITGFHWRLIERLADAGLRVVIPLYGLAPAHTAAEAFPFVRRCFDDLVQDVGVENTTIAGDSAGGGLALGITQVLAADGIRPARLALIAPWLDIALTDPGVDDIARHDPWLVPAGLREAGRAWRGELSPEDPRVSPLRGRVEGLPPTTVYIGDRDIFLPDALHLVDDIRAAGGEVELVEQPGAVHAYPLTPTPEGRDASRRIVAEAVGM
ncbi:alpha/beta hydrolase [uncultured Williamsia sp.]|uniref:alpha/beta hydrolase fold domain-containing protein n=1 Tax=uncultured Williamsia sp. TaxID=259311 RepID=UPI0026299E51|nr:alpha/beta hydrolase [uncultured Williamsia sp.]